MLGEMIGECMGKVAGVRVISTEGQETRLEVSLQGQGTLLGQAIADFGTLVQPLRSDDLLSGDAHHVMMTANGEAGDWSGSGVGQRTGAGFKSTWGVTDVSIHPKVHSSRWNRPSRQSSSMWRRTAATVG